MVGTKGRTVDDTFFYLFWLFISQANSILNRPTSQKSSQEKEVWQMNELNAEGDNEYILLSPVTF